MKSALLFRVVCITLLYSGCASSKKVEQHERDINQIYKSLIEINKSITEIHKILNDDKNTNKQGDEKIQQEINALKKYTERMRKDIDNKKQENVNTKIQQELTTINKKIDVGLKSKSCSNKKSNKNNVKQVNASIAKKKQQNNPCDKK